MIRHHGILEGKTLELLEVGRGLVTISQMGTIVLLQQAHNTNHPIRSVHRPQLLASR